MVDQLDLSAIESVYEEENRGQPPYHPRMMTKILLYGYCVGVFSSRKIQKRLVEDVAFRVLAAGNEPDFRTICGVSEASFEGAGRTVPADVTADVRDRDNEVGAGGTGREQGEGQREQAQSHELRADEGNREAITGRKVWQLLNQAEAAYVEEDSRYGRDRRGDELPEELQRRETRIARIREAKRSAGRARTGTSEEQGKGSGGSPADKEGAI